MAQTIGSLQTRLDEVRTAISRLVTAGVSSFAHEGGDQATMVGLAELRQMESELLRQLASMRRGGSGRFRPIRPVRVLGIAIAVAAAIGATDRTYGTHGTYAGPGAMEAGMQAESIVAGVGIEPTVLKAEESQSPRVAKSQSCKVRGVATGRRAAVPAYSGAEITRFNYGFQPPHRSGDSSVSQSWDMVVRRFRWLADNTPVMSRLVGLLVQQVIGEGLSVYSAAIDHLRIEELLGRDGTNGSDGTRRLLTHPLFLFGDESDAAFERWASEGWADVERRRSLWELHAEACRELLSSGNFLWLEVNKPTTDGSPPVCYQVIEAEQLDRGRDRAAGRTQNLIRQGIEYAYDGEPLAYWVFDAHPYDDQQGWGYTTQSRRIPASRVIHGALTTRASQHFGVPLGQAAMQTARDADWLVGHELTAAAIAAGLTLLIKESDTGAALNMDGDDGLSALNEDVPATSHLSEVGLAAGTCAHVGPDEDVQVVESGRPNPDIAPFMDVLTNLVSMSGGVSWHRLIGNPKGASFATLRAMINDDRAMALPLTNSIGRRIGRRPRQAHDRWCVARGRYQSVDAREYLQRLPVYEDYDVLGPPLRHLNPTEDVNAARERIRCGMSTLRIECGQLGLSYRAVLRQLAVERDLTRALELAIDFSSGGGAASTRTTTDAGQST